MRLTDNEVMELGYDDRGICDAEPLRREIRRKCNNRKGGELTPEELEVLRTDIGYLFSDGDMSRGRTIAGLRRKADC